MGAPSEGGVWTQRILKVVEPLIYARRAITLSILLLLTAFFLFQAAQLKPDASWLKMVPQEHPYMKTFLKYYDDFGGANTVLVALHNKKGDIYQPEYMEKLRKLTDAVFFIPGVDRARVVSIFTPNILYIKVVEGGLSGSTVVPTNYKPTPEMMEQIRSNVSKANVIGRLVSEDASTALVVAELLDIDPVTGEELDYVKVGDKLEAIRKQFEDQNTSVNIIGFAKVVDDMTDASIEVGAFFVISLILTSILLFFYVRSFKLTLLPMFCSVTAVIWELGLLKTFNFGLDPFAMLVPFLILSVSVSHGVQYVSYWSTHLNRCKNSFDASLATFRELAIPGTTALLADVAGFVTMYIINIEVIREMAFNAAFGMFAIIITNKVLMPILLTYVKLKDPEGYMASVQRREAGLDKIWRVLAKVTRRGPAVTVLIICAILMGWAAYMYPKVQIGDTTAGVPELRPDSRFNQDARAIASHFTMGVDQFKIIAKTVPNGCVDYDVMSEIDNFSWYMKNQPGVRDTLSLLDLAKLVYQGLNQGRLNSFTLPRDQASLAQSTALVPTTTGFLNDDCSAMAIFIFTKDHKSQTISKLVQAVKDYKPMNPNAKVEFLLASGNVGVMAATNEVVKAKELPILLYVYAAVLIFLWLSFRTFSGVLCVALPLSLVSMMIYAVMVLLDVGMKVATLPVVALATGIGVDYGIYIYSVLASGLRRGLPLEEAYFATLKHTGKAVIFTGITLGLSVVIWLLSKLQFQADMGALLTFAFTANMIGAIVVLPSLAHFLAGGEIKHKGQDLTAGADAVGSDTDKED